MISEYAVDPACAKRVDELLRVLAGIGGEHGRLVAEYPGGWAKRVLEVAKRLGVAGVQHLRLSRRLDLIRHAVIETGRAYDDDSSWFTNASSCAPAFRAVISTETTGCAHLITVGSDLNEENRWAVSRGRAVPRKAMDIASAVAPILLHAREVVFVDPHFAPEGAKWRRPLVALLRAATRRGKVLTRCEFHLKAKSTDEFFADALEEQLGPELPAGSKLVFFRWKQRVGGEDFHRRFVLTENCGIGVDFGLDEGDTGEVTDMMLLDRSTWERRRADFSAGAGTFEAAGGPIELSRDASGMIAVTRKGGVATR
jgi:hypothetical protein